MRCEQAPCLFDPKPLSMIRRFPRNKRQRPSSATTAILFGAWFVTSHALEEVPHNIPHQVVEMGTVKDAQHHIDEEEGQERDAMLKATQQQQPHHSSIRRHSFNDTPTTPSTHNNSDSKQEFMDWCRNVLGIQTLLELETFEYYDYMKALPVDDDDNDDSPASDLEMISVRGMAASRDIEVGEVLIRIPVQSLLRVTTTIDQDPVLGPVMGPNARTKYGWTMEPMPLMEIPLLAMALLHHKRLGSTSPWAPYIRILEQTPTQSMPFLWSPSELRTVHPGIRTVAKNIQKEMADMYATVVQVLIEEHPELFGGDDFSFQQFQWAFAMMNSRHWQLPIQDWEEEEEQVAPSTHDQEPKSLSLKDEQLPPADMPTEKWVAEQHTRDLGSLIPVSHHAYFLAPVADMLNFGPPCTRGSYNRKTHSFEIIASCPFRKGQEATYWYSDECDDIMVGVYGFTHPIVPPCPTAEDYRRSSEEWRSRAEELEHQLVEATQDYHLLDSELTRLQTILKNCDCCRYETKDGRMMARGVAAAATLPETRHENHVRGGFTNDPEDVGRRGIRKMRVVDRNTEL